MMRIVVLQWCSVVGESWGFSDELVGAASLCDWMMCALNWANNSSAKDVSVIFRGSSACNAADNPSFFCEKEEQRERMRCQMRQ